MVKLSRERALSEAVALADRDGIDAVSMRALAARLGVVPMAIYRHVADKGDLLDGMVDLVVAGYEVARCEGWKAAARARVMAARRALLDHPWLRQVIETRGAPMPHVLMHMNAMAGILIGGGLSVDLAHHAMHALGHRIWGFSPEAFAAAAPAAGPAQQEETMRAAAQRYPHIVAIAVDAATRNPTGACDEELEFEFTLDLLLYAFERLHASGWSSG